MEVRILFLFISILSVFGCMSSKQKFSASDLEGRWAFFEAKIKFLSNHNNSLKESFFVFYSDGTAEYQNIPRSNGFEIVTFLSGEGEWEFTKHPNGDLAILFRHSSQKFIQTIDISFDKNTNKHFLLIPVDIDTSLGINYIREL